MKKLLDTSMLLCLFIALTSVAAFAQTDDDAVRINPFFQDEVFASGDDTILLWGGWAACTKGLVRAFITTVQYEWSIDGDPILLDQETADYFGPIVPIGFRDWCLVGDGTAYKSNWGYSLGTLPPGSYDIRLITSLDHPIADGGDWDGDGRIDIFTGIVGDDSVKLHVEGAP